MRRSGGGSSSGGRRSGGAGVGAAFGGLIQGISDNKITLLVSAGLLGAAAATYFYLNSGNNASSSSTNNTPSFSNNNDDFNFAPTSPQQQQQQRSTPSSSTGTAMKSSSESSGRTQMIAVPQHSTASAIAERGAATITGSTVVSPAVAALAKEVGALLLGDGSVRAPETKPTTADAWYLLGTALLIAADLHPTMSMEEKLNVIKEGGKRVKIEGKEYNSLECFQEGLMINAEHDKCWLGAARVMFASDKSVLQNDTESVTSFTINNKAYNGLSCSKEALRLNPSSSEAWCLLGWQITSSTGPVQVGNKPAVTRTLAFVTAIELNPADSLAWLYLGTVLGDTEKSIPIQKLGMEVNCVQCYIKAIEADKTNHRAWYALGLCIDSSSPVLVGGQSVRDVECFINVLTYNPANAEAWYNLGTILPQGGKATIQGSEVDEIGCFQASLELNPNNGDAWYSLGVCLGPDHAIPYGDDGLFTRRDCYLAALAVDETLFRAWYNLGLEADEDEKIQLLDGTEVDPIACCVKSVLHNNSFAKGWYMLGKHLKPGTSIQIGSRRVSREECQMIAAKLGLTD